MKNTIKSILALAVAAMAFASCQDNLEVSKGSEKNVQFFAQSIQTKTAFGTPDGTIYPTLWTSNDSDVKVSLNGDTSPINAAVTPSNDYTTASFNASLTDDESGSYVFRVLSPASAALGYSNRGWNIEIPTSQTPSASSVDEAAQVIVAKSAVLNTWPVSPVELDFTHFTAYGKISILNLEGGATISGVSLTAESNWAGRYYYNDGAVSENSASKTISISTNSASDIWFACAPVDLSNKSLKITVTTDNGDYIKIINFPSGKGNFQAGKIAKFAIDFDGITSGEDEVYSLVTIISELTVGSKVIIASGTKALSTTQNSNNRGEAVVAVTDNKIINPSDAVQILEIQCGVVDETVAFYTGSGYLYAASSDKNYLRTQDTNNANGSFSVSISEGTATLTAQGTFTRNLIQYNEASSVFSCYSSASQSAVKLYKQEGSGSSTPAIVVTPSLTAPDIDAEGDNDNKTVYVTWGDVANATSYLVECGSQQQTVSAGVEEYTFTVASYGDYDVYVTAQADGYKSAKSEKVTVTLTDPNSDDEKDFNKTYEHGLSNWSLTNYTDQSTYYQVPTGTGVTTSVATIANIFKDKTITSDVVITINCATYGSGTNPSSSTFSVYKETACTNQITASQGGTLPTSSTYQNVTYTITKANAASFANDLAIKITKPGKTIRLKSIKVVFKYTE